MYKTPCKDCGKRYPGCHDHCNKYQLITGLNNIEKEKIHIYKQGGHDADQIHHKNVLNRH